MSGVPITRVTDEGGRRGPGGVPLWEGEKKVCGRWGAGCQDKVPGMECTWEEGTRNIILGVEVIDKCALN